jgi:hypothetical protein
MVLPSFSTVIFIQLLPNTQGWKAIGTSKRLGQKKG